MKKYIYTGLAGGIILLSALFFTTAGKNLIGALHTKTHDFGFCDCESDDGSAAARAQNSDSKSCANSSACANPASTVGTGYSADEQKVIDYISEQVATTGNVAFQAEDLEKALGVSLQQMNPEKLRAGVLAQLQERKISLSDFNGQACGNCSKFSACSVDRDLSGASGEELERYAFEKSQDGQTFTGWQAPDFTLPNTDGRQVRLSDYRGKPVVLVFLSGHCSHSFDTLPILNELANEYVNKGVEILPVYVNSGSVEDILSWSAEMNLDFPLVVSEDKTVSGAYGSRMVPSTFFIDADGYVTRKFVGYKDKGELQNALNRLLQES